MLVTQAIPATPEHFHSYIPAYYQGERVEWKSSPMEHTDEQPFCAIPGCMCHFDARWVDFFFVRRIERGEMTIEQGLDLFSCREVVACG